MGDIMEHLCGNFYIGSFLLWLFMSWGHPLSYGRGWCCGPLAHLCNCWSMGATNDDYQTTMRGTNGWMARNVSWTSLLIGTITLKQWFVLHLKGSNYYFVYMFKAPHVPGILGAGTSLWMDSSCRNCFRTSIYLHVTSFATKRHPNISMQHLLKRVKWSVSFYLCACVGFSHM